MSNPIPSSGWRRARVVGLVVVLLLLALSFAFLSMAPSVHYQKRATAEDVVAARNLFSQLNAARGGSTPVRLSLDAHDLRAIAILASEASGSGRVEAEVSSGVFTMRTSLPLRNGIWINAAAKVTGAHTGFPTTQLQVGRVTLPAFASRWSADLLRWVLLRKGVELPELDLLVRRFSVADNAVIAELALPTRTGLVERVVGAMGAPVNESLVSQIYCQLAQGQLETPTIELAPVVQQAFSRARGPVPTDYNRAAFVAVALHVVGEQAHSLAPAAVEQSSGCHLHAQTVVLRGRADLAKHWALSAALTAVLGEEASGSLGEWKELNDSLPQGSGFSFVDLAADRSGFHFARKALDPQSARRTAQSLGAISGQDLLPDALLREREGLGEAVFVTSFGSRDERRYRDAIARIDKHLVD
jgi:uncharacterized protein YfiM (DUF2279 family)